MSQGIESASFDRAGVLNVRYAGRSVPESIQISPVPRPRAQTLGLRWDTKLGVVVENADPIGQRFTLSSRAAALHLIAALQEFGPVTVSVQSAGRATDDSRGFDQQSAKGIRATEPAAAVDLSVLSEATPGSFLIAAANRWAPRAPVPKVAPWSRPQIDAFVLDSPRSRYVAETIARLWSEYKLAGGRDSLQFATLAETLLVQWERKNASAAPGFLHIAFRPFGWGLYRQGNRWYDEKGFPIIGPGGVYWDHSYLALEPPDWAVWVAIDDRETLTLLTYLGQAIAGGTLDVVGAAQGYLRNTDLLVPAVLKDWPFLDELSDELLSMLPLLVVFIGTEPLARLLIMTRNPPVSAIGVALLGLIKVSGWLLNISFLGVVAANALLAGRELLLVRRGPNDKLDQLAQKHLANAVSLVRKVIVDVATVLAVKAAGKAGPSVARRAATQGRAIARQLQFLIRTELAAQLAGTYGTGPSFDMVAMSAELPEDPLKSKGSGASKSSLALGPRPVDIAPENWRELEKSVIEEFQRSAPKNSPTYYTSRRHKLSTIWNEFLDFVKVLQSSGQIDPIPNADPKVLELTRGQLIKGTPLGEECEGTSRWLEARLRESERRVAASDRSTRKTAEVERSKWHEANVDWLKWLGTKVGNQMLDLFELNPSTREAAVIDPSYAWSNRLHNLKSRVYLESLNRLLGWKGGSALDVGKGRFQSRIFYDPPKTAGGAQ